MKKKLEPILILTIAALCFAAWLFVPPPSQVGAEDQTGYTMFGNKPRVIQYFNVAASSSGDNEVIATEADETIVLLAITVIGADDMTAKVSYYLHAGSQNLIGTADATVPIDKSGIEGYGGVASNGNAFGWAKTTTAGDDVSLNLSGAQEVICYGTYIVLN